MSTVSPSPSTTVDAHRSGFSGATHRACHGTPGVALPIVDRPIGMFDSGFGGLTVARALIDLLPSEDLVYIGDTGRYPYGSKPLDEVRRYANELAWSLVKDFGVKAVVVACNTATAAGLDELRDELPVPVIDVIEPGARAVGDRDRVGPCRRDRHRRHDLVGRVPSRDRPHRRPGVVDERRVSGFRRVRRTRSDDRRRGDGARRAVARADLRRAGRRPAPRVHALPVPRASDQRCDGARGHARQFGRRDGVRGARDTRRHSGCCATTCGPASIASCRAATSTGSASSAPACSAPSSTTPNPGHSPRRQSPRTEARPPMTRPDGRDNDELRPVTFERDYTEMAAGSCLVSFGRTRVLCTASVNDDVPRWMRGSGKGWVTAEYSMLPGSSPERVDREAARGKQSGRTVEIQRLIGRSLQSRVRHEVARRTSGGRRLRRAAGRRRHAHGQHLWRLPRVARCPDPDSSSAARSPPIPCSRSAPRSASASSTASRCSTCRTSRTAGPRST